jgi:hypothetical protein
LANFQKHKNHPTHTEKYYQRKKPTRNPTRRHNFRGENIKITPKNQPNPQKITHFSHPPPSPTHKKH